MGKLNVAPIISQNMDDADIIDDLLSQGAQLGLLPRPRLARGDKRSASRQMRTQSSIDAAAKSTVCLGLCWQAMFLLASVCLYI